MLTNLETKPTPRMVRRIMFTASELMSNSTSDPDFQCRELPNVSVLPMLHSRSGQRAERHRYGNGTQSQRQSRACTGLLMVSQWKVATLDAELLIQDGSNTSNGELHSLIQREKPTRSWIFPMLKTLKTEIS